jgi:glutathione S-transferase
MSILSVSSSVLGSTLALWQGSMRRQVARIPEQPLRLYDIEACPYCRRVRETLTELDLDALILPCPKNGTRFRPEARERAGRSQFPLLVDPNTGTTLLESADILAYLHRTYGRGPRTQAAPLRVLAELRATLASAARPGRGLRARASRAPAQPLELFSFESSPYSRLVRERLCELELPYLLRNTGKARATDIGPPVMRDALWKAPAGTSRNRRWLLEQTGKVQVPYLVDANTGQAMYESAAILAYLERQYAA